MKTSDFKLFMIRNALLAVLFVLVFCVVCFSSVPTVAYADSDILAELSSMTINEDKFDVSDYPSNPAGNIELMAFVKGANNKYYIYLYNPKRIAFDNTSLQNKIEFSITRNTDVVADDDLLNDYKNYQKALLLFDDSTTGAYNNLFLKFEVKSTISFSEVAVSGIELKVPGEKNATEFNVCGVYRFNENGSVTVNNRETVCLDVKTTNYLTGTSSAGKDHRNMISTIYFAIPNDLNDRYEYLNSVLMEWWEYKTKDVIVTCNQTLYDNMLGHTDDVIDEYSSDIDYRLYSGMTGTLSTQDMGLYQKTIQNTFFEWSYNIANYQNNSMLLDERVVCRDQCSMLPFVFKTDAVEPEKFDIFNIVRQRVSADDVSREEFADYIYDYSNDSGNYIDCNGRMISEDLFQDSVDDERTMGHNTKRVEMSEKFDLASYRDSHNWIEELFDYWFWQPESGLDDSYSQIEPIKELTSDQLLGESEDVSRALLVAEEDVDDLKSYHAQAKLNDETVYMIRYAVTDYYTEPVQHTWNTDDNQPDTYRAQSTVFFDVDVIELEFMNEGMLVTIPVVSSPADNIPAITRPEDEKLKDSLQWVIDLIIGALSFIAVCFILIIVAQGLVLLINLFKSRPKHTTVVKKEPAPKIKHKKTAHAKLKKPSVKRKAPVKKSKKKPKKK